MFKVLDLNTLKGREEYQAYVNEFKIYSAYSSLEYLEVFCGGFEYLICFVFEKESQGILMPGYLKKIKIYYQEKDFFDFSTPYGYSGPFYTKQVDETTLKSFWKEVENWQCDNNVVSEFVRFNLFNNTVGYNGTLHKTMLNIKGKIFSEEDQWKAFDAKVRKNVKKAQRENLSSTVFFSDIDQNSIEDFYSIYIDTMKRTNATDFFFYSIEAFSDFILNNKNLCAICTVYDNNKAISTELLLISNNSIFSFLGGTLSDSFDKRPNDFLKFEVINWARLNGFEYYVLGGGYGYEDGIFKYKKAFFPNDVVEYVTGRKIVNFNLYKTYVNEVNSFKNGIDLIDLNDTSFFPLYNKQ